MKKKKYSFMQFLRDTHLWLGLVSGIVLFLVCLSGTILTYNDEILEFMDSDQLYVETIENKERVTVDSLISRSESEIGGIVTELIVPFEKDRKLFAMIRTPDMPKKGRGSRGKPILLDPYTGSVSDIEISLTRKAMHGLETFHRYLLLGKAGKIIVGVSTIIFLILIVTGFIMWLPKKWKNVKNGLKIKFSSNCKRINYDVHNTLGFYSIIFLIVMALSGLNWSFEWYRKGMSKVLDDDVFKIRFEGSKKLTKVDAPKTSKTIDDFIQETNHIFTYNGMFRISFPTNEHGTVLVRKKEAGYFVIDAANKVHFDPHTGKITEVLRFSDLSLGEKINEIMRPLHLGSAFGGLNKLLYFIACLIATTLPITGTIIWFNKLKKNKNTALN